ncbi:MAG: hypothetical protein K2O03_03465, partial [Lachnospiraceae bacterium]|nr:hypothetical protein [Lachnospiraceae bacterium]
MNLPRIRKLTATVVKSLGQTAESLHGEIVQAQVVPRDKGTLQGEAFFVDYSEVEQGRARLVHSTPYARRLYYHPEYHFSKAENPNARGEWFTDWLPGGKKEKYITKTYKG